MASGSNDIGSLGPEHVRAVAARALDDADVREDRGERPDVVLELLDSGAPYGTHCIMIPPGVRWAWPAW